MRRAEFARMGMEEIMIESNVVPPLAGNINFNAQHAPMGAFMSFTCGHFGSGGGIGLEIGRPANQNIYIGVKEGGRRSPTAIRCLPFLHGFGKTLAVGEEHYSVEHASPGPHTSGVSCYQPDEI